MTLFTFGRKIQCDCGEWVDLAIGHQQLSGNGSQASQRLAPHMSPHTPLQKLTQYSRKSIIARMAVVLILTVAVAASSILMVGPQMVLIVPLALVLGLVLVLRRSFWSLVSLGYLFTFGMISAWIAYMETPSYEQCLAFAISISIGLVSCVLIAVGLWKALPGINDKEATVANE